MRAVHLTKARSRRHPKDTASCKQQQKQRTQLCFPDGIIATLSEIDTVGETEHQLAKAGLSVMLWEVAAKNSAHIDPSFECHPATLVIAIQ